MQKGIITTVGICLVFILSILLPSLLLLQNGYAFTYQSQDWWFAREQQSQVTGDLGIIFTYPDRIIQNDTIDVNVRIEYMNNENARGEYAILDDMKIHVRNNNTRLNGDIGYSENVTSPILRPGETFFHTYSIPTQHMDLQLGNLYAIDLSFIVSFGEKTKLETYYWDSGEKFGNSIEPQELRPFELVAKNSTRGNELTLRINTPFGLLRSIEVLVDNKPFVMQQGVITSEFQDKSGKNITLNENTKALDPRTTHLIKMEETIPLLFDNNQLVMRGNFTSWSDGFKNPQRIVDVNKNIELFAIYTAQYYLNVTSSNSLVDVVGEGWYDSGTRAQFSTGNLNNSRLLSFDHWIGDINSEIDPASPSNSIIMDSPITIQAVWKQNEISDVFEEFFGTTKDFFYGFLAAAIIGPLVAWLLTLIYSRKEKKRNLIYLKTYIPLIDNILKQNIKEKDVCHTLLDQKRNEITALLQAGIINIETFRLLNEHITDSFKEISNINQK